MKRMADTYASCSSYRDSGDDVTVFINEGPRNRRTISRPFRTLFVRPDLFRFEFRNREVGPETEWPIYAIWRVDGITNTYWSKLNRREQPASLSTAVAGATGVSGGTAHTVSRLLMGDEIGGFCLTDLVDLRVEGEEQVDGHQCVRLAGRHPRDREQTIWIDGQVFLIRQMYDSQVLEVPSEEERNRRLEEMIASMERSHPGLAKQFRESVRSLPAGPTRVESTTYYSPELDVQIDQSQFEYNPGL
jgi:hypothetical protein